MLQQFTYINIKTLIFYILYIQDDSFSIFVLENLKYFENLEQLNIHVTILNLVI